MIHFLVFVLVLLVFRPWISVSGTLSAGDWPYLFAEHIRVFSWTPELRFLWLAPYYQILTKVAIELGLSWQSVERIFWFLPWIFISFFAAKKFTRSSVGGLIYTTNTYALMLVGGGQMGVAMAYAAAPVVLLYPWALPFQVMFDPRIALLTVVSAWIIQKNPKQFVVPILITAAVHAYWWLPLLNNPAVVAIQFQEATAGAVKYLSFASFSNTLSLIHPNWPENIFGKVYFMRPEFLGIPIIAFGVLIMEKISPKIVSAVLLALIGAFLAKGASEPFGGVYLWLFDHIPGFSLFRDATKFYLFVAIGYSFLISRIKNRVFLILFIMFWAFTIREAITGSLAGTFRPIEVSADYVKLKESDVAWYPKKSRFSFSGKDFVSLDDIEYVVVPDDLRGEIFVTDRKYDEAKRQHAISAVATMSALRRVDEYKDLAVFEVIQ